jgi:hypothetical protein
LDDFLDAEYNVHQTTASDLAAAATAADGVLQFELDEEEGESEQLLQHRPAGAAAATHPISLFTASAAQHSSVEVNDSSCSSSESVGAVLLCLYASHALSRWAWRTWEFAVVRSWLQQDSAISSTAVAAAAAYRLCWHWRCLPACHSSTTWLCRSRPFSAMLNKY